MSASKTSTVCYSPTFVGTGAGQAMVMAGYESEDHFSAARHTVDGIIEAMSEFLTDTPHGHAGNVVLTWKGSTWLFRHT